MVRNAKQKMMLVARADTEDQEGLEIVHLSLFSLLTASVPF